MTTDEQPTPENEPTEPVATPEGVTELGAGLEGAETEGAEGQKAAPPPMTLPRKGPAYGFYWGTGRRKSSVASVRLREGSGTITVNRRDYSDYFRNVQDRAQVDAPLAATESASKLDIHINVRGGGMTGQAGAVKMGLARALRNYDETMELPLREAGFMTRDSRMKERKKPGQPGARRKFQFSKR